MEHPAIEFLHRMGVEDAEYLSEDDLAAALLTLADGLKQLLDLVRGKDTLSRCTGLGGGINTFPNGDAKAKDLHGWMLELERRSLVYRHHITLDCIAWRATEKGS
jgi:hypothetical protein